MVGFTPTNTLLSSGIIAPILVVIISGYILHEIGYFKFKYKYLAGQHLYFRVLTIGVLWLYFCEIVLSQTLGFTWISSNPVLIIIIAGVVNLVFYFYLKKRILKDSKRRNDFMRQSQQNSLMGLENRLREATYLGKPIMITLDNGKVYIGWHVSIQSLGETINTIRLSPVLSGYREKESHQLKLTTNYEMDSNKMFSGVTDVVIVRDRVVTLQLFDSDIYNNYFSESTMNEVSGSSSTV